MPNHEPWMQLCESAAVIFSRCSRRSYYSIVLSPSGRVLGTGYNGSPSGLPNCTDGGCPRATSTVAHGSPYTGEGLCPAIHAEANALLHSDRSAREGGTLYVNGPPCWECSKLIAGSGITTVVHTEDSAYAEWPKCLNLLHSAGIRVLTLAGDYKSRDSSGSLGVGTEVAVDLARSPGHGTAMADLDRQWKIMGFVAP